MPAQTAAVLIGLLLNVVNFAIFIAMSTWALRRRTTTASAIMVAGIIVRLTVVFVVYVLLALSSTWGSLILWVTAGFIPSLTVLMAVEIALLMRMEKKLLVKTNLRLEKASQCE